MTKNREIIYSIICSTCEHLNAEEIYLLAKQKENSMVYATVYNCLKYLVDNGFVRRIQIANNADRYDRNLSPHDHFMCKKCGIVIDEESIFSFNNKYDKCCNKIESYELIYQGICSKCLNK